MTQKNKEDIKFYTKLEKKEKAIKKYLDKRGIEYSKFDLFILALERIKDE